MILRVWKWSQSWAVALKISNLNSFKQCSPSQSVKHTLREDRDTLAVSGSNEAWWNNIKVLWNGQVPTPYWFPLNDHALVSVLFFFHSFHKNFPYRKHQQPCWPLQSYQHKGIKKLFSPHMTDFRHFLFIVSSLFSGLQHISFVYSVTDLWKTSSSYEINLNSAAFLKKIKYQSRWLPIDCEGWPGGEWQNWKEFYTTCQVCTATARKMSQR